MRIKHFAGYGTVEAKKVSKTSHNGETVLTVLVTGDHEVGLIPYYIDPYGDYTLKKWLLDRFDKKAKENSHLRFDTSVECVELNERAVKYTFVYNLNETDRKNPYMIW